MWLVIKLEMQPPLPPLLCFPPPASTSSPNKTNPQESGRERINLKEKGKNKKQEQRMLVEESQHWETDLTACV